MQSRRAVSFCQGCGSTCVALDETSRSNNEKTAKAVPCLRPFPSFTKHKDTLKKPHLKNKHPAKMRGLGAPFAKGAEPPQRLTVWAETDGLLAPIEPPKAIPYGAIARLGKKGDAGGLGAAGGKKPSARAFCTNYSCNSQRRYIKIFQGLWRLRHASAKQKPRLVRLSGAAKFKNSNTKAKPKALLPANEFIASEQRQKK